MTEAAVRKEASPREAALDMLLEIFEKGEMSHLALRRGLEAHPGFDKRQRAFTTRLVEGTLERALELDYVLEQYSKVPVKKMKPVIRTLLRMGIYQILYMDSVPESAACNETVKLAGARGFYGLKGFVNGVMRRIASEKDRLSYPCAHTKEGLSVRGSMPSWIVEKWLAAYGWEQTETMVYALLEDRPVIVHMNLSRQTHKTIIASLKNQGVEPVGHSFSEEALILSGIDRLETLEAFREGWIQVQDISSQLAGRLALEALIRCPQREGEKKSVMDICAAPGGKSLYAADGIARLGIPATVLSRDLTKEKTALVEENRRRMGFSHMHTEVWDARCPDISKEKTADVLIADLPCSGLGILARKNDIKYHVTKDSLAELVRLQREILSVGQGYVKPGGYLVYSTCTVNPEENEENVRWILERYPYEAVDISEWLPPVLSQTAGKIPITGLQLLPGIHDSDGFFMAVLRRKETDL